MDQIDAASLQYQSDSNVSSGKVLTEKQTRASMPGQPEQPYYSRKIEETTQFNAPSKLQPPSPPMTADMGDTTISRLYAVPENAEEQELVSGQLRSTKGSTQSSSVPGYAQESEVVSGEMPYGQGPGQAPHGYLGTMTVNKERALKPREVLHNVEQRVIALPETLMERMKNLPPESQLESFVDVQKLNAVLKVSIHACCYRC